MSTTSANSERRELIARPAGTMTAAGDRANAYHALASALAPPSSWDATIAADLRSAFAPLGERQSDLAGRAATAIDSARADMDQVAVAHARLFLGPFEIQAPPYESFYLDTEHRLMGPVSHAVAGAYAEAGLAPGPGPREAPDHITLELEFMYFLTFQQATAEPSLWLERQVRFWQTHLGRWLHVLARAMSNAAIHPCYDALADLLLAFAGQEAVELA